MIFNMSPLPLFRKIEKSFGLNYEDMVIKNPQPLHELKEPVECEGCGATHDVRKCPWSGRMRTNKTKKNG